MRKLIPSLLLFCAIATHSYAQNVGIGNTSPASKMDVSGDLALREGTAITVASGANTLTLPTAKNSVYRLTGASGAFSITSISGGNDGMLLTLINATGQVMTITNGSIQTNTGANLVGSSTVSTANLIYNATLGKWLVVSGEGFTTSSNAWNLTGNAGTTPGTNFIGTTDNNALYFKTNGNIVGYLPSSNSGNTYFGVGNGTPGGSYNVAIGYHTTNSGNTGNSNVTIGWNILDVNTTGHDNVGLGWQALANNTTGAMNVSIGLQSLGTNKTGGNNIALGYNTLNADTSGSFNIGLGNSALIHLANGLNNVAIGYNAGYNAAGSSNVFLGNSAGYNETGSNKLYISNSNTSTPLIYGDFTNQHLTVNDSLTAQYLQMTNGANSGYILQSDASGNATWVNPSTLPSNNWGLTGNSGTTSSNFVGTTDANPLYFRTNNTQVGYLPASISDNITLGVSTRNPTGTNSVLIGNSSGNSASNSGHDNTSLGYSTLHSNTTGYSNTAIGSQALNNVTTGVFNTAVGASSQIGTTTGFENVSVGTNSLFSVTTGTENTALGTWAGFSNNTGSNNTFLGNSAGNDNNGSGSVFIGNYAGYHETGSNKLYIANTLTSSPLIYGDFNNNHLTINDSLTAKYPQFTNGANAGYILQSDASGNGTWVSPSSIASTNIYNADGTLTGNRTVTQGVDNITFSSTSGNFNFTTTGHGNVALGNNVSSSGNNSVAMGNSTTALGNSSVALGSSTTAFGDFSTATGIGTYASGTNSTAMGFSDTASATGSTAMGYFSSASGTNSTAMGINTTARSYGETDLGSFNSGYTPSSTSAWVATDRLFDIGNGTSSSARSDALTVLKNGNVGIGNNSPSKTLQVNGTTSTTNFQMTNGATNTYLLQSDASGNGTWVSPSSISATNIYNSDGTLTGNRTVSMGNDNLTFNSSSGNLIFNPSSGYGYVGIGTTAPLSLLANTATNILGADGQGVAASSLIWAINANGYAAAFYNAQSALPSNGLAVQIAGTSANNRILDLSTSATQGSTGTTVMAVFGNGNVGIGTSSPAHALDIATGSGQYTTAFSILPSTYSGGSKRAALELDNWYILQDIVGNGTKDFSIYQGSTDSHIININTSGQVGINTTSQTNALQVNGTTSTTNFQMTNGGTSGYVLQSDASGNGTWVSPSTVSANNIYNSDGTLTGNRTVTQGADNLTFSATTGNLIFNPSSTGSMGVGTTSPGMKLDVASSTNTNGTAAIRGTETGSTAQVFGVEGTVSSTATAAAGVYGKASASSAQTYGVFGEATSSAGTGVYGQADNSSANAWGVNGYSNGAGVGVAGNANAAGGIGVWGFMNANGGIAVEGTNDVAGSNVNIAGYFSAENGSANYAIIVPSGGGSVGIGTSSPNGTLAVVGKGVFGDNTVTNNDANDNLYLERVGSYTQMHLYNNDGSNSDINAYVSENTTGSGSGFGNNNPGFNIWTASAHPIRLATNATERLTILSGGNVGINNTNPGYTLAVGGTTSTTNLQITTGATNGYILKSDASGNASWVNPTSITTGTTNTSTWTQSGGLVNTVNGVAATVTPASGTITNVLGYNSSGAPVYQAISGLVESVSNTVSGNTISTTVDGTTGTAVNVPNIYTANGTLTGTRTVTMGADNLTFSATTGDLIFIPSSTGYMGIGTASPAYTLDVAGASRITTAPAGSTFSSLLLNSTTTNTNYTNYEPLQLSNGGYFAGAVTGIGFYNSGTTYPIGKIISTMNTSGSGGKLDFYTMNTSNASTDRMTIDQNGYVGIGTTTPESQLANTATNIIGNDGQGVNTTSLTWTLNNTGYTGAFYNASTSTVAQGLAVKTAGTSSTNRLLDLSTGAQTSAGTSVMVVLGNGQVGIGTSGPTNQLSIQNGMNIDQAGTNNGSLANNTSTGNAITFGASGSGEGIASNRANSANGNLDGMDIYTDFTRRLSVTNSGLVGINTTAPGNTLTVNGSGGFWNSNQINFYNDGGSTAKGFVGQNSASSDMMLASVYSGSWMRIGANGANIAFFPDGTITSGNTPKVVISSAGYIGVGTTSPAYPLEVTATVTTSITGYGYLSSSGAGSGSGSSGSQPYSIHSTGRILSAEVDVQSDRRIKKDIESVRPSSMLDIADKIRVVNYDYIDKMSKGSNNKTGFIAQEVESIMPGAVNKTVDVVPNVFAAAQAVKADSNSLTITTPTAHNFAVGDEILLYDKDNKPYHVKVASVSNDKAFTINGWTEKVDEIFVYGKKVNDLRAVDFDQITAVAIGAVQELNKKTQTLEQENNELKATNEKLRQAMEQLKTSDSEQSSLIKTMKAQIDAINERLNVTSDR